MESESTTFSSLLSLPETSFANNTQSFWGSLTENSANPFALALLIKLSFPSFVPYLLLGPSIQIIASFLLFPFTPKSVVHSFSRRMKWRTTFIARISAAITGSWAVWTIYESQSLASDLMFGTSWSAQHLILFSLGVHVAESVDMLLQGKPSMLLVHHVLVVICFAGAVFTQQALGFAVLSLVTEVNAVFNKTRILHIITSTDPESLEYKRNAVVNIVTFFIRILIIGWMNNQCFLYIGVLPLSFLIPCTLGLGIVNIWNLSVFKTLIKKDIIGKQKSS